MLLLDSYQIQILINYRPRNSPCLDRWTKGSRGFSHERDPQCLAQAMAGIKRPMIRWDLVIATQEAPDPLRFPPAELNPSMSSMLKYPFFYYRATTVQVLHRHIATRFEVGPFTLEASPHRPGVTTGLVVFDPLQVRNSEDKQVLVRTRLQLKHQKPYYLGMSGQSSQNMSILAATYTKGTHG